MRMPVKGGTSDWHPRGGHPRRPFRLHEPPATSAVPQQDDSTLETPFNLRQEMHRRELYGAAHSDTANARHRRRFACNASVCARGQRLVSATAGMATKPHEAELSCPCKPQNIILTTADSVALGCLADHHKRGSVPGVMGLGSRTDRPPSEYHGTF